MASQAPPLPANSVVGRVPDRETPFSPYNPEIDISTSAISNSVSQASVRSSTSIPSTTSTTRPQHHYPLVPDRGTPFSPYNPEIDVSTSAISNSVSQASVRSSTSIPSTTSTTRPQHRYPPIPDRETPFSPYNPEIDISNSASLQSSASLPSTTSTARCEHQYPLINGKGNWLTLIVTSRSPSPRYLPMFIGTDVVNGFVELDLTKPENIREVTITIKGETTQLTQEPHVFLEMSRILVQSSGKLAGKHSHPFSFNLPNDVTVDESNWAMVYPLPPKFHEKGILYIDYKIIVTVRRGKFSLDNSLVTNIVYLPETIAEPPSALREQSYINDIPLAPPSEDPRGWKLLPLVESVGTIVPDTTMTAQLAIATPLSFALGTPIPLYLELHASDGLFGSHPIDVRLVRTLVTRSLTGGVRKLDIARARFWEAPGSSAQSIKLMGEITIGRRLTPTFDFSKCSVRYSVVLYPRRVPEQTEYQPLVSEEVLLTLRNAPGISPRSKAPTSITSPRIENQRSMPPRFYPVDFGLVLT
ncbi:hypothetical protein BJV78DRAFT_1359029 [Lactifluus subvellereus]|nr:hypothetical protein BJV78DRAFT_1359029 [Lactifluus subvellereus]